jgi:hypothetical protein
LSLFFELRLAGPELISMLGRLLSALDGRAGAPVMQGKTAFAPAATVSAVDVSVEAGAQRAFARDMPPKPTPLYHGATNAQS